MSWLRAGLEVGLPIGAVLGVAAAVAVARLDRRASREQRGELRFDTPRARSALRRCNPARDVHYFGGQARCECGEVTYGTLEAGRAIVSLLPPIEKRGGYQPTALGPPPTPPPKPEAT